MYNPISVQIVKLPEYAEKLSTFVTEEKIGTATRAVKTLSNLNVENIPAKYTIADYITNLNESPYVYLDCPCQ